MRRLIEVLVIRTYNAVSFELYGLNIQPEKQNHVQLILIQPKNIEDFSNCTFRDFTMIQQLLDSRYRKLQTCMDKKLLIIQKA